MTGLVMGVGSAIMNQVAAEKQVKAQQQAILAQAQGYIQSMNYGFQNFELERQDALDQTISELAATQLEGQSLSQQVAAILGDQEKTGRTANLIQRNADAQSLRQIESIKDNYARKSNEIDLNKETTLLNTQNALQGLQRSMPSAPSRLGMLMDIGMSVINYSDSLKALKSSQLKAPDVRKIDLIPDYFKGTPSSVYNGIPMQTKLPSRSSLNVMEGLGGNMAADTNRIRLKYGW